MEQDELSAQAICLRILNDMTLDLARRYGVRAVAHALTELVGCQSCMTDKAKADGIRALLESR